VAESSGEPAAKLEPLSRFTWKRLVTLLGAFAVVYLVLPQLANAGAAVRALQSADWWWVLAALPAIFVAQAFSTLLLRGTIPADLSFGPTYIAQFGGSFLNRVTPNNVGGMALNFRYLQKAGVDAGAATGSVGLQTVASDAATLLLVAVFFARTGRHTAVHFGVHSRQWLLLAITAVLVAGALLGLTPRGRRFFRERIWGFLRSAGSTIAEVAKSPHQVALIGVGALCGPLVQIAALALCVHALGGDLPVVQVGAVYLGSHVVASAAPVPGGLGAFEAGPHCRADRPGHGRRGRRLCSADIPVVDLLVDHPGRLDRSQDRGRAGLRLTTPHPQSSRLSTTASARSSKEAGTRWTRQLSNPGRFTFRQLSAGRLTCRSRR
jgi:uncharacterized protein (TIRG00374 family)